LLCCPAPVKNCQLLTPHRLKLTERTKNTSYVISLIYCMPFNLSFVR
jgi:hypothetical protein